MKANIEVERKYPGNLKQKIDAVYKERGRKEGNRFLWQMFWFILISEKIRRKIRLKGIAVDPKLIVFEDDNGIVSENEIYLLLDYMIAHGYQKKYRFVLISDRVKTLERYRKKGVKLIRRRTPDDEHVSLAAYKTVARAKYVFFTGMQTANSTKKDEQIYIQLCQNCDMIHRPKAGGLETILDYAIISGERFIYEKSEYLDWMEESMLPIGRPIYDYMLGRESSSKRESLPKKKCNVFWEASKRDTQVLLSCDPDVSALIGLPLVNELSSLKELDAYCEQEGIDLYIAGDVNGVQSDCLRKAWKAVHFIKYDHLDYFSVVGQMDAYISDYGARAIDFLVFDKPVGYTIDDIEMYRDKVGLMFEEPSEMMYGQLIRNLSDMKAYLKSVADGEDPYKNVRAKQSIELVKQSKNYCQDVLNYFGI